MKKIFLAIGVLSLLCPGLESVAQLKPEEIADFAKWEEFLRTATSSGKGKCPQAKASRGRGN